MYVDYHNTIDILKTKAFEEMSDLRDHRKLAIETYINDLREEVIMLSSSDVVVDLTEAIHSQFFSPDLNNLPTKYRQEILKKYKEHYEKFESELSIEVDTVRISNLLKDSLTAYYQYHYFNQKDFFVDHPQHKFIVNCHDEMKNISKRLGLSDIYIVDNETGYVMYSIPKKADFAINLLRPSLDKAFIKKVGIVELFQKVRQLTDKDDILMSDYFIYRPSFDQPAAFLGSPIVIGNEIKASLLVQLPVTELDNITRGLAENSTYLKKWNTGLESYVIGRDKKLRTNSKVVFNERDLFIAKMDSLISDDHMTNIASYYLTTILMFELQSKVVEDAAQGNSGTEVATNYLGEQALSSYIPLDLQDVNWVLITEQEAKAAFEPIEQFVSNYYKMAAVIIFALLLISVLISKLVTKPILNLVHSVKALKEGDFDYRIQMNRTDEVRILADGFNEAIETIGKNRKKIQSQNELLKEREKEIKDSIKYAQIIQKSILPRIDFIKEFFGDAFIYYKPKDIVSGDFYWWGKTTTHYIIAAVDCTGHGIPGALLSMKANSILHKIVGENMISDPAIILENLDLDMQAELRQQETQNSDGMDISIISVDIRSKEVIFSGAHNSIYIWKNDNKEMMEIKATRRSIGGVYGDTNKKFENNLFSLKPGDVIYMFSDGVVDQIGGMKERKLMKKNMASFLQSIAHLRCDQQYQKVNKFYGDWIHPAEEVTFDQLDDMLLLGIKCV